MLSPVKTLAIVLLFGLFTLAGCAEYIPIEPPANTGAVFQRSLDEVQTAARNALTKMNFAITKENTQYIEAVHLKAEETVKSNDGELVGIWFKPRTTSVLILIDTAKTPKDIAGQRDWEQPLLAEIMRELQ